MSKDAGKPPAIADMDAWVWSDFAHGKFLAQGGKDLEHQGCEGRRGAECKRELFGERSDLSFLLYLCPPSMNENCSSIWEKWELFWDLIWMGIVFRYDMNEPRLGFIFSYQSNLSNRTGKGCSHHGKWRLIARCTIFFQHETFFNLSEFPWFCIRSWRLNHQCSSLSTGSLKKQRRRHLY